MRQRLHRMCCELPRLSAKSPKIAIHDILALNLCSHLLQSVWYQSAHPSVQASFMASQVFSTLSAWVLLWDTGGGWHLA